MSSNVNRRITNKELAELIAEIVKAKVKGNLNLDLVNELKRKLLQSDTPL